MIELIMPWDKRQTKFSGNWDDRLCCLFTCGVDFAGKSILDLGCNIGIVAYEVAKREPAAIHGIDISRRHIQIARAIFEAIPIESRFEVINVVGEKFKQSLKPSYDVVLLLGIYHHLRKMSIDRANSAMREVASRCLSTIIVRHPGLAKEVELFSLFGEYGFRPVYRSEKPAGAGRLSVLSRSL